MMLLALLLLGAQAGPPPAATAPAAPAPAAPAPAAPAGATTRDYRIGPGDTLRVTVYGHEDLSPTVVVQPAGTFVFPLLGSVKAAGATPTALEALLRERLEKGLIRDPQVSVVVQDYRSQVVFAVGEVTRPGAYPLAGETSVVELLARAGPVSPSAGSEVIVVGGCARAGSTATSCSAPTTPCSCRKRRASSSRARCATRARSRSRAG
jgi:polysaccharide export outer membrane protein